MHSTVCLVLVSSQSFSSSQISASQTCRIEKSRLKKNTFNIKFYLMAAVQTAIRIQSELGAVRGIMPNPGDKMLPSHPYASHRCPVTTSCLDRVHRTLKLPPNIWITASYACGAFTAAWRRLWVPLPGIMLTPPYPAPFECVHIKETILLALILRHLAQSSKLQKKGHSLVIDKRSFPVAV